MEKHENKYDLDVLKNQLVEVKFLRHEKVIFETLQRIGLVNVRKKFLTRLVHVFNYNNKRYLAHYKMLYDLKGKESTLNDEDLQRFYTVLNLLEEWGHIEIVDHKKEAINKVGVNMKSVYFLKHEDSKDWKINKNYTFNHPLIGF